MPLIPAGARVLVDLGSGAGFPGLVLALATGLETHLIESDQRKRPSSCALFHVKQGHAGDGACQADRAGARLSPADVVTARALAALPVLLGHAARFCRPARPSPLPQGPTAPRVELTGPCLHRRR